MQCVFLILNYLTCWYVCISYVFVLFICISYIDCVVRGLYTRRWRYPGYTVCVTLNVCTCLRKARRSEPNYMSIIIYSFYVHVIYKRSVLVGWGIWSESVFVMLYVPLYVLYTLIFMLCLCYIYIVLYTPWKGIPQLWNGSR